MALDPVAQLRLDQLKRGELKRNHRIQSFLYAWLVTLHNLEKTSPKELKAMLRPAKNKIRCLIRLWEETRAMPNEEARNQSVWNPIMDNYGRDPKVPSSVMILLKGLEDISAKGTILHGYFQKNQDGLVTQSIGDDYLKVLQLKELVKVFRAISSGNLEEVEEGLGKFSQGIQYKIMMSFYTENFDMGEEDKK